MKSIGIIPARMAATRFPGKPLAKIKGMPMIGHVYKRATVENVFTDVYVATCDQVIMEYVESIGGKAVMTSPDHERCTDRTAEALIKIEAENKTTYDCIGMIQGDEPTVTPSVFKAGLKGLVESSNTKVINIMNRINSEDEFNSTNTVKVVINNFSDAIYFSRAGIPSNKKSSKVHPRYRQTGMIFFLRDFLLNYLKMEPTPLEEAESVDMLRIIEHGHKIKMVLSETPCLPVDIPDDIKAVEDFYDKDFLLTKYL